MVPLFIKCLMTHLTDPLRALPLQLPHDVPFVPHVIPDHSRPALKLDLREYVRDTYMCVIGKSKRTEQRRLPRAALRDVRCSICLVTLAPWSQREEESSTKEQPAELQSGLSNPKLQHAA